MDNLLLNLETEFFFLTGVYLEGISGLVFGILIFSLLLSAIRYEKKQELPAIISDISNEIGDERIAKINLSRSLIEMGQEKEAKRLLDELLQDNPTQEEKRLVSNLFEKINS
jgi:thioredoxin-like negative regulator of GroEL